MNLSKNSNVARLYRWFYATRTMPNSLCPYFWKLVLMWILIIPYTILALPYIFTMGKLDPIGNSFGEKPGSGIVLWLMIYLFSVMVFSLSLFWYSFPEGTYFSSMQILGILLWMLGLAVLLYNGIIWAIEKYKRSKIKYDEDGYRIWEHAEEKPSIIIEFIKAKYNKYCPKINWNE
jgi:hypothetical protein